MKRLIVEMGQGVDLHGMDYTKAAVRAVDDALRHASLTIFRSLGLAHADMQVEVLVGAQEPEKVDPAAVAAKIPFGTATVRAEKGGVNAGGGDIDTTVICTCALVVRADVPEGKWRLVE